MPSSPIAYAGFVLMLAATGFALWAGRRLERTAAGMIAAGWVLVGVLQDPDMAHVPWASFTVDALEAAAFVLLAVSSGRTWVACLAAFQLLNLSSYLAFALDPGLFQRTFISLSYVWSVGVLGSLVVGGLSARRGR